LKTYAENAKVNGFVVGISGGVDSAVTSTLCAQTGLKVLCLKCPSINMRVMSVVDENI
jgi:NAD+ synthase